MIKKRNFIEKIAIFFMFAYFLFSYVGYINPILIMVSQVSLYAFLILSIICIILNGSLKFNTYLVYYLVFLIFGLFACLYAPKITVAFKHMYTIIVTYVLCFMISNITSQKKDIDIIFKAVSIGSVILMVYLIRTNLIVTMVDEHGRFGEELTGNANIFGNIYMIATAVSVFYLFSPCSWTWKIFSIFAVVLQFYALIASGGRKYLLFPIVITCLMLIQKGSSNNKKYIIFYVLISVVVLALSYYLIMNNEFLYENIGYRFEDLFNYASGSSKTAEGGTIEREKMIKKGIELWFENPIWGNGTNAFLMLSDFGVYSHNNFVELLCNYGIIGFVMYYGMYIAIIKNLIKAKFSVFKSFFLAFIVSLLINELGAITYNSNLVQVFLMLSSRMFLFGDRVVISKSK